MQAITSLEFEQYARAREARFADMVQAALAEATPEDYAVVRRESRLGVRYVNVEPIDDPQEGMSKITVSHAIIHSPVVHGEVHLIKPTSEMVIADRSVWRETSWVSDAKFGGDGPLRTATLVGSDMAAAVRDIISRVLSESPFVQLGWHRPQGAGQKWLLLHDGREVHSIFKKWAKYFIETGESASNLASAMALAESAARQAISWQHMERLAGLEDGTLSVDGELLEAPASSPSA